MVKRNAQKKGGVMAKEWWKSRSNEQTIEDLVAMGVLHNKALVGMACAGRRKLPRSTTR